MEKAAGNRPNYEQAMKAEQMLAELKSLEVGPSVASQVPQQNPLHMHPAYPEVLRKTDPVAWLVDFLVWVRLF